MSRFSQRKGLVPERITLQTDSMDIELRNGLWSLSSKSYFRNWEFTYGRNTTNELLIELFEKLYLSYYKKPIDTMGDYHRVCHKTRLYFFKCQWFEVYDFIEFLANNYSDDTINQKYIYECNILLENEKSAYRFIGGIITDIITPEEKSEIENALNSTVSIKQIHTHLDTALRQYSNKKDPDYRNSIKESISAVEGICRLITGKDNITLGDALDEIERRNVVKFHPALKGAFHKIYGYTCSADGIRHALLDEKILNSEDARFMLIACSAFINYLLIKVDKSGISL